MTFIDRLFSGSDTERNGSEQSPPSAPQPPGDCVVPPDHRVTVHRPTMEPMVQLTHGGAFVVDLGSASDEFQEELRQIADEVDGLFAVAKPTAYLFASDAHSMSGLFAPNDVSVSKLSGLLLWIIDAGSAHLWEHQPDSLLAAIRRVAEHRSSLGPMTQLAVLNVESRPTATPEMIRAGGATSSSAPPGTSGLIDLLSGAGVPAFAAPQDGVFFIEVCRPDATIGALRTGAFPGDGVPHDTNDTGAPESSHFVTRAPRLCRLTLAAAQASSEDSSRKLFEELLSRQIPLLVMTDRGGRTRQMTWKGVGDALPVYPDLSSLVQAARDLKVDPAALAWAHFSPRDLFAWVDREPFGGIAINAYSDPATPAYFFVDKSQVKALANGRIPDSP